MAVPEQVFVDLADHVISLQITINYVCQQRSKNKAFSADSLLRLPEEMLYTFLKLSFSRAVHSTGTVGPPSKVKKMPKSTEN